MAQTKAIKQHEVSMLPKVSIILPCFNVSHSISLTIDKLRQQEDVDWELIVVDGHSTDRTVEIVKGYFDERILVCYTDSHKRYEMLNKGLLLAKGEYVNFIFPGDYYILFSTLSFMMQLAVKDNLPDLLYGGCLLRQLNGDVKVLNRPLSLKELREGKQPTTLQSCFFKRELMEKMGGFQTCYEVRGGYDLFCRLLLKGPFRFLKTKKVLTDYDLRGVTKRMIIEHFLETSHIIHLYFGWRNWLKWFWLQKDVKRWFLNWGQSIKNAFLGR